jgi:hypothetical protein
MKFIVSSCDLTTIVVYIGAHPLEIYWRIRRITDRIFNHDEFLMMIAFSSTM